MSPFAALEARLNAATLARLANATALVDGVSVSGIFDNGFAAAEFGIGMAATNPRFTLATSAVPANPRGKAVQIDSALFVIEGHEPDGKGMSTLILERAA